MEKIQAKNLIEKTFNNRFNKEIFRNFIINFLDGINESKAFSVGQAQVKEAFQKYILSYQRIGQYTDSNGNIIDALIVHLDDKCSLDRNRTMLRNFVADYMRTRGKENTLVAFYNNTISDWRFSFVKLDISLKQDEKGNVKVVNEFTPAKRYSFLVGELEPNHTAQSRLVELLAKEYPTLNEIEEAFNVEKVSKEFFANYKELFLQLVDNLKEIRANEPSQRINTEFTLKSIKESDFCKKLLGQLVFLYFIQKKGWLGVPRDKKWGEGDKQFLRHTFERAVREGKNFFNDYLEHLFYDALANGERDEQYFSLLDCKIPFLNGGLFETIGNYSWVDTDIIFENEIFSNTNKTKNGDIGTGILDVFDRYNFTVKEDEPLEKEVAVDPEMLGKVFEELLEVEDRKSKGAFYTPREIVHYMCQESLINYLATELNAREEAFETNESEQIALIQPEVKQLGFKNLLTKQDIADFIHHSDKLSQSESIATEKENQNSKYKHQVSQAIIDNAKLIDQALENIKICDPAIGSGAFPVGMLNEIVRARIALVESGFLRETKKRSVYEYKRQAIQNSIYGVDIEPGAVEIAKLRLWLSLVVDEEDIENIKALPNLDYKIVCGNSLLNVERNVFNDGLFTRLEELKPQFFNETRKSEKRRLKKEIDAIIEELTKDGTFDFEIYFSEVFNEKGGFDVIIANPPYITYRGKQKVNIEEKLLNQIIKNFPNSAEYKINSYALFIELGCRLLKTNQNLAYIIPSTILHNEYLKNIRKYLINNYSIDTIVSFSNKVFEAITDSIIIFLSTSQQTKSIKYYQKNNLELCNMQVNNLISINNIKKTDNYVIEINNSNNQIIEKIEQKSKKLDEYLNIYCGIVAKGIKQFLSNKKENDKYKKYLQGKHINKYLINYSEVYINFDKEQLHSNTDENIYMLPQKILLRKTGNQIIATLDEQSYFTDQSLYNLYPKDTNKENLKFLLAILNSSVLTYYYNKKMITNADVFPYIKGIHLKLLPIIQISLKENKSIIISIVEKILTLTKSEDYLQNPEKQNAVKEYEKQIDIMVYKLYELTYEEVLTIDKDFTLSEQQYNDFQL